LNHTSDLKGIPAESGKVEFALVLTDPPYGINLDYNSYTDTEDNWFRLMTAAIPEMTRVAKMVIFPACKQSRLRWYFENFPPNWIICWYKGSPGHRSFVGFNDWEAHLVYGKTKSRLCMHDYFQTMTSPKKGSFGHPCPKPIEWATWFVSRATDPSMTVLDPFMGSGTTGIACKKLNRKFIGIELDIVYYSIAKQRISASS
jgi:DNA modification methylase